MFEDELAHNICEFPFKTTMSFEWIIEYWEKLSNSETAPERFLAREIMGELQNRSELNKPISDRKVLESNQSLIKMMVSAVIAPATVESEIGAVITPYGTENAYTTPYFNQIFGRDWTKYEDIVLKEEGFDDMMYRKTLHAYFTIFKQFYGVDVPFKSSILLGIKSEESGLHNHYKVDINNSFSRVKLLSQPKELTDEQITELIQNSHNLNLWLEYLPPHHFDFQGIAVFKLIDVTDEEILSQLKYELLDRESLLLDDKFEKLQHQLRSLFRIPDLKLGVAAFNRQNHQLTRFGKASHSLIIGCDENYENACPYELGLYEQVIQDGNPLVVNDLSARAENNQYWKRIVEVSKIQSMVFAPLKYDGDIIGIMELGASQIGQLSSNLLLQIQDIIPLFSIALQRNAEERESSVEAVIKRQYTAIHPAVEWRFEEAATRYLEKKERGLSVEVEPISFKEVYPLYGASDIRNSSNERSDAIQADLLEHLNLTKNILKQAISLNPLPILEEVHFKITKHIQNIEDGLFSGDEMSVIDFLRNVIEPCFDNLEGLMPQQMSSIIAHYRSQIDPKLGVIYKKRKEFESSLTKINELVSDYVESEQEKAQKMFPHYFEKYKTDGVEYNIYIGQSMTKRKFHKMFLKNLRLWQLLMMSEIARKSYHLIPELPIELEMTHLILVHNNPLSVRFRLDERQFDVDGAYNIRYEIVKKRIDKSLIKGTNERLTQPHKIAIVYSNQKDADEYKEYFEYLKSKGEILDEIEDFELEALQGVQGLRALRVSVNLQKVANEKKQFENVLAEAV